MARNTKLFADSEQINPKTIASQVQTGGTDVEAVLQLLTSKITELETRVGDVETGGVVRLSSRIVSQKYWDVVFENWKPGYEDSNMYRLCIMQRRSANNGSKTNKKSGAKWRVPMYYELHPHPLDHAHPELDIESTFISPKSSVRLVMGDILEPQVVTTNQFVRLNLNRYETIPGQLVFAAGLRRYSYVGVALFKNTGRGQFGWERISNIAGMKSVIFGVKKKVRRLAIHEV